MQFLTILEDFLVLVDNYVGLLDPLKDSGAKEKIAYWQKKRVTVEKFRNFFLSIL